MKPPNRRRYGLISDVHAHLPALEAALRWIDAQGVDQILNLGDMVGYGQQGAEVLDCIMARSDILSILGNHDRMLCGGEDPNVREIAREVITQTRDKITERHLAFLRGLPEERLLDEAGIMLVHSSLTERDAYILSAQEVKRNLECLERDYPQVRVCLFGHTHIPMVLGSRSIQTEFKQTRTESLTADPVYLINPGSVGQPRDRCPLAACGVLDLEQQTVCIARLPVAG